MPPRVPVCPIAYEIENLKDRLVHYRQCDDPRCQARIKAADELGAKIAADLKRQRQEQGQDR